MIRGGPDDNQTILSVSVDGDTATLSVCYVDQSGVYDAATGAELVPMDDRHDARHRRNGP